MSTLQQLQRLTQSHKNSTAIMMMIVYISILLSILLPANAQVQSINAAKIDQQETLSIFFSAPQTFSKEHAQSQFSVKSYNDENYEYEDDSQGQWHLSKDGYRLSYYPVSQGSYQIETKNFHHTESHSVKNQYLYIGTPSETVKIIGRGPVLPLQNASIPVEMLGTNELDIEYYAIENLPYILENYYIGSDLQSWTVSQLVKNTQPAGIFRYVAPQGTKLEEKTQHRIPLDKNIKPGAYLVTVNPAGQIYKDIDTRIVFISNIGLQARLYPNSTLIIGNQFSNNAPLNGDAILEIWRSNHRKLEKSATICTFKDGLCEIPQRLKSSDVIVVKQHEDISILPLKEIALDLNEYPITGALSTNDVAYLYANRTLFRPGETITLNTLLRDRDGQLLPAQPLTIALINPQGKVYSNYQLDPQKAGFYQTDIKMPIDAKTGVWKIEARTDATSELPLGSLKLYIEEFMPERMELIVTGEARPYQYDEMLDLTIHSRYLFGAPAALNDYNIQSEFKINRTPFTGKKDWFTGIEQFPAETFSSETTDHGTLDDNGETTASIGLPFSTEEYATPSAVMQLNAAVNILDGSVLGITRSVKHQFWPGKTVPVIRPLFQKEELGYGQDAKFELFTATPEGKITPSKFLLSLKYQDPYCTWVYSESRGWDCHSHYGYQIREQKVIESTGVIDYEFSPNSWGDYTLEIKDLNSGLTSEFSFAGSWNASGSGQLPAAKPLHLNLSTQKPSFTPGEMIELTIDAPLTGNLTLLVEGTSLLFEKNLSVQKGQTTVKIPFDSTWNRHDLYISGLLISHDQNNETVRSLGIIPLKIETKARQLQPELSFPAITKPDQPVTIEIALNESQLAALKTADKEALYATVSITDRGILNMIPEKPVSIFDAFFKHRRYSAEIIDYYSRLFKRGNGSLLNPQFGGDAALNEEADAGIPNLTEMKTVSLSSELISLENGKASITFDLPDFNGEAEVAVKLFNQDQVGEANETMVIRAPIIADIITPRFIRVGDQSFVSLTLVNMSGQADDVEISLSSEQFEVTFKESISLKKEEKRSILIPIKLTEFAPFAEVMLDIDSNSFKATRSYQIGTVHKTEETALYERKTINKEMQWQRNLEISGHFSKGYAETVTLSRYPQINVLAYTNGLFQYPYGCTEQITSKAFPWLFKDNPILDAEKTRAYEQSIATRPKQTTESFAAWETEMMKSTINRLLDRQRLDGGFSLWSDGPSYFATTVYITDFLSQAKTQYPALIPQVILDDASKYLKQQINAAQQVYNQYGTDIGRDYQQLLTSYNLANVSYAAWILAKEGKIFNADILFLKNLEHRLSPLGSAYLGASSMILGSETAGNQYLSAIWQKLESKTQTYGYYQSSVSELALSLSILNELTARGFEINPQLQESLLLTLDTILADRRYFSTQDRYALIKLGIDMPQDQAPIKLVINGEEREITANTPIPANSIASLLTDSTLFMEYQISGYPKAPVQSTAFPMDFTKSLNDLVGQTFKVGDRITVRLEVNPTVSLPSGLIVDYIPGGFNLVNPNLISDDLFAFYEDLNIDFAQRNRIEHEEFRFDRYLVSLPMEANQKQEFVYIIEAAVPGKYEIPVTVIEDMYQPELRNIMVKQGTITIEE